MVLVGSWWFLLVPGGSWWFLMVLGGNFWFSFYDFVIMFIDLFAARCEKYRPASVNSIGQGLREGLGIGTMVLSATNNEENLNGINLNHAPKNGSI